MHPTSSRTSRARAAFVAAVAAALITAGCASDGSDAPDAPPTASTTTASTTTTPEGTGTDASAVNPLVGSDGRFAHAAPRLAKPIALEPADGGGATATFSVAYDVAHPDDADGAAPDQATLVVAVASAMNTTGPQPTDEVFATTITDDDLDAADVTRDYSIDLPAAAYQKVQQAGDDGKHLLHVGVQQQRDFRIVDGTLDWTHGTTFDAASSPTEPADNPGGAVTVTNDTNAGVYSFDWDAYNEPVGQEFGANLIPQQQGYSQLTTSSEGVTIALSGEAVSCLYQGTDGSNPAGFTTTLAPGAAVTQTIVADDDETNQPANANDTAEVSQAVIEGIDAGLKAIAAVTEAGFSAPFTLIVKMADALFGLSTSCNNQPNVFQLAAVTDDGQGTNSTSWAISDGCGGTCGALSNVYSSPWESSAPPADAQMSVEAVQLAPSTTEYEGQALWLNQAIPEGPGCGVGDGSDSNTSGCTAQNAISLQWLTSAPCPWTNGLAAGDDTGVQGNTSWCFQPAPTSPEISSCGTDNASCLAYEPDS